MNIPTPDHVKYRRVYKELTEYLNVIVTKRKALNHLEWPNDILSRLLTSETMTSKQIRDHLITLFVAGADTTGKLVGFALYALAINPEVDERLYQEITNVSSFSLDTFHKMPLMLQMLKETLRKWPPAPFYIRDLVTAFQIDQVKLLPGDAVMLSPFLTGMHKDFWDKPEKFDINRFSPEEESIRHKYAFHAFASGPRNCIGQHFAYLEATIALGIILREYRVVLPKFYLPELTMTGTLTPKGGLPMQFVKRH